MSHVAANEVFTLENRGQHMENCVDKTQVFRSTKAFTFKEFIEDFNAKRNTFGNQGLEDLDYMRALCRFGLSEGYFVHLTHQSILVHEVDGVEPEAKIKVYSQSVVRPPFERDSNPINRHKLGQAVVNSKGTGWKWEPGPPQEITVSQPVIKQGAVPTSFPYDDIQGELDRICKEFGIKDGLALEDKSSGSHLRFYKPVNLNGIHKGYSVSVKVLDRNDYSFYRVDESIDPSIVLIGFQVVDSGRQVGQQKVRVYFKPLTECKGTV